MTTSTFGSSMTATELSYRRLSYLASVALLIAGMFFVILLVLSGWALLSLFADPALSPFDRAMTFVAYGVYTAGALLIRRGIAGDLYEKPPKVPA